MARIIWILLLLTFITSSWLIYTRCDEKNISGIPDEHVKQGWKVWQEKNCQGCHQIYGLGGYMGPDLTNVASQKDKVPIYMKVFIQHGTGRMPDFHLNDSDVNDLILYLAWIDKSGKSRVPASAVEWTGSLDIKN